MNKKVFTWYELIYILIIMFSFYSVIPPKIIPKIIDKYQQNEQGVSLERVFCNNRAIDLATYYELYKKATPIMKDMIGIIVAVTFSEFDKEQLINGALKQFLVNQRYKYNKIK